MSQPGPLTDLVGATVDQHESLPRRLETTVRRVGDPTDDSEEIAAPPVLFRTWAEWLDPDAAGASVRVRCRRAGGRSAGSRYQHSR